MSLLTALTTGTAGLQANSSELAIVGDNIANANTIGFKAGRAAFQDQLMQQIMGIEGGGQMGLGTRLQAIQRIITQGALTTTGLATDLALDGSGYFVLHNQEGGQFYTRAGQFTVDRDGYLTSLEGMRVQGFPDGMSGQLGDLQVGAAAAAAIPTSNVTLKANMNADAPIQTFDINDPTNTSSHMSNATVYDSLGKPYSVSVYWNKTAAGAWEYHATTDGANLSGGTPGQSTEIGSGQLNFDTDGKLIDVTGQTSNFLPNGATQPQAIAFNFGPGTAAGGSGIEGVTQYQSASATTFTGQDGAPYGALTNVSINNKGEVIGAFTNGTTRSLGQVAVADFEAGDRLQRIGSNLMTETLSSGSPTIGAAGEGGRAGIVAGALEQSNVDLAGEFVRMIAAQRGFQANSKTITTADQLLQELMQLKR